MTEKSELDTTKNAEEKKWKIEDAVRTLEHAESILADKKLFDAARKELEVKQIRLAKLITKLKGK